MAQFHPFADQIVCRRLVAKEHKTEGGLYTPDITHEISPLGLVVDIGASVNTGVADEDVVRIGDVLWIGQVEGRDVSLGDRHNLVVLTRAAIIGRVGYADDEYLDRLGLVWSELSDEERVILETEGTSQVARVCEMIGERDE